MTVRRNFTPNPDLLALPNEELNYSLATVVVSSE